MMQSIQVLFDKIEQGNVDELVISEGLLQQFAQSEDFTELALLYDFITGRSSKFIEQDVLERFSDFFIPDFLLKCMQHNPQDQWAYTSYTAAWEAFGWFVRSHRENEAAMLHPRSKLFKFSKSLSKLYLSGDGKTKEMIIIGFLEHILFRKGCKVYFNSWKKDPDLKKAIECATNSHIPFPKWDK